MKGEKKDLKQEDMPSGDEEMKMKKYDKLNEKKNEKLKMEKRNCFRRR